MKQNIQIIHPTLLLDIDKCHRNIERMCKRMALHEITFRPHFKTHQSRMVGSWFRDFNVDRITVSSLRMAMYFADDGWSDITVAFPVNLLEIDLINDLAGRITLNLIAEEPDVIQHLDRLLLHHVGVFLKMDSGTHRTGLDPRNLAGVDACVDTITRSQHLSLKGFLSHAGHTYQLRHQEPDISTVYATSLKALIDLKAYYQPKHPDIIVSFGDTPGASIAEDFSGIDEMRPGNFVFYDIMQVQIGSCAIEDIAVAMICPVVVCHPQRNESIIYGGGIHFAKDSLQREDGRTTFGTVVPFADRAWQESPEYGFARSLSQEHGVITVLPEFIDRFKPGELIAVLPVHSCMTAQCMAGYLDTDGNVVDHFAGTGYYLQ